MKAVVCFILTEAIMLAYCAAGNAKEVSDIRVADLRCEYLKEPLGIDIGQPRLSWVLESEKRGQRQTAYQILVASSKEKLDANDGDIWDNGKVESDQSIHVVYKGSALRSRMRCWWKVRVYDRDGQASAWSEPSRWEMGLLEKSDWQGKWIGMPVETLQNALLASPFLRKEFLLGKAVRRARAYISGLGYYELYLNGKKVGDHVLDPAFTRYDKRALYVTYDVTEQLKRGNNAVGVILGNGWYNRHDDEIWDFHKAPWRANPAVLCQIEVEFTDGTTQVIASDASWKATTGPIVFNSIRGEVYDAQLEMTGWCQVGFDDSKWASAAVASGPKGKLCAQMLPAIKVAKTIEPVKVTEPKPGIFVFDMGQNFAGRPQLKVSGPKGTKIVLKYSDLLAADGTVDQSRYIQVKNTLLIKHGNFQTDTYILKGQGQEVWEPRFLYHGFQYVEIHGFPGKPTLENLRGRVIHTSFEPAGQFECSDELLNKIQKATLWSYLSNFQGYPTDCPQREKNGWTGDAHLACETGLYNFDSASAYTKWMNDFADEQKENGMLPGIVPTGGWGYDIRWMKGPQWRGGFGPAWDSAYILIPWYLYQYCGDVRILEEHYNGMKKYVDFLKERNPDYICGTGLGDWCPATEQTDKKVTSTGYYYADAEIISKIAELLGRLDDAKKYRQLAGKVKEAFNKEFFEPAASRYSGGTQTANSCALYHGLIPEQQREEVLHNLLANIERHGGHLDAGILGTKYLLNSLTDAGKADVVFKMATQRTYPSWGHWIEQGATTLWEDWDGVGSHNHIMFGPVSEWFYKALAGINVDANVPGFKRIVIKPQVVGDLKWVRAKHFCMYGDIESWWRKYERKVSLDVTIPVNTTAVVFVPASDANNVTENGKKANEAEGVRFLRSDPGRAVFEVGSGRYSFQSEI